MVLKSYEDRAEELERREAELSKQTEARAVFESMTPEERIAQWNNLVNRTKKVIDTAGLASFIPYDGHYNARSESKAVEVARENGIQAVRKFSISHEPSTGAYHPHDAGVRWLSITQEFVRAAKPDVSVSGGVIHLNPIECIDQYSVELLDYIAALEQAEAILGIR